MASRKATSPGSVITATPRREIAVCMAISSTGHLFGVRNQLTIVAALREEMFRMGFLEVPASYFIAGDLRRDGEDGNPAALTVVETIDQMQISGAAATGTDC